MPILHTPLCDLLHIALPIVQAPMGRLTTPALAAAVSNAGGLGMLGLANRDKEDVRQATEATRRLTDRPFGVNFLVRRQVDIAVLDAQLDICLHAGVPVVSFFWDDPAPYIARVHAAGALVMYTVPSAAQARRAVDAGVDIIVAQGWEAGGHVQGEVAPLPLVPRVVDAVTPTPVVAAGGIADGRGLAAALALGASGIWMGTRFLASAEATTHPVHLEQILQASETDTIYGGLFDIGWPEAPHRALRNSTIIQWEAAGRPPSGQRPGEGDVLGHTAEGRPIVRYRSLTPLVGTTGTIEAMSLYAGQSVGLVTRRQAAGDIVRDVAADALRVLRHWAGLVQVEDTMA
jgi:nitronate monooxygenase